MARVGYVEARNKHDEALRMLNAVNQELAELADPNFRIGGTLFTSLNPKLQEVHRIARQKQVDKWQAEYDQAKQEFESKFPKQSGKGSQVYYPEHFVIKLSCSRELGNAIRKAEDEGTSHAELTRQALEEHLGLGDSK